MKDISTILGNRILFLGCHFDDVEFGCGALLKRCANDNKICVRVDTLSSHNEDSKGNVQLRRDITEVERSMHILGLENRWYAHNIPGQKFDYYRQDIRELLLSIKKSFAPDTVFFPAFKDIHQDHSVLADEGFRIFRDYNCLGYEVIRSSRDFSPNLFLEINEDELSSKIEAIMSYKSQKNQSAAYYFDNSIVRSIATFRGAQANISLAEAFCVYCYRIARD